MCSAIFLSKILLHITKNNKAGVIMKAFAVKHRITIIIASLLVLTAGYFVFGRGISLRDGVIAEGVKAGGIELGEMTVKEAEKALSGYKEFSKDMVLRFECEGEIINVDANQIELSTDIQKSVNNAYKIGRSKDAKKNKEDIKKASKGKIELPMEISFNEDKLLLCLNEHLGSKITDPSPLNVEIEEDSIIVTNSTEGIVPDMKTARKSISKELGDLKADGEIAIVLTTYKPKNPTFEEFVKTYVRKPKDATYTKDGDSYHIEPEVVGIELDTEEARRIYNENKDSTEPYTIPAKITYPEITASYLEDKYVNKIIAKYSTSFSGSSANRCLNIALAASKIDGYVVNPGERFSYNKVVGPRTEAAGFRSAHVYVGTKVVDGIGGGICQVSSTLYNAVVMADLKTVTRVNHSIPVSYVPLGRDATVSYGTIDYVFENNKSYPISIKAKTEGTTLTISIVGTSEMDYTVDFVTEFVSSIAYGTTNTEDDTLPEGETKLITPGSNGSVYQSYRVYKKDGKTYDKRKESKSRYQPVAAEVAIGTKKEDKPQDVTPPEETETMEITPEVKEPETAPLPEETETEVALPETDINTEIVHPEEEVES